MSAIIALVDPLEMQWENIKQKGDDCCYNAFGILHTGIVAI